MKRKNDDRQKQLEKGAFYTPMWFSIPILNRLNVPITPPRRLRVVDPAMGDGALLETALLRFGVENVELYGVDLDETAISNARRRFEQTYDAAVFHFFVGDGLLTDKLEAASFDL